MDTRPKREAIGKAYASYHTHADGQASYATDNGTSLLWRISNGYMNARFGAMRKPSVATGRCVMPWLPPLRQQLDYFYRHLPSRRGRLLDVGCGNGVFLLRAKAAGWLVQGVEPDPIAAEAARGAGLSVFNGTLDAFDTSAQFDAITSSHVIEHVHEPRAFVSQLFDRLRPGGFVWLATPNATSLGHRRYGEAWRGLEPPRHITVLTPKALRALLLGAGFTSVRAHRRGRGSRYILQTSAELSCRMGRQVPPLSHWWVDGLATISPYLSEELVMSARKESD
ncbi:class I SAM-dependent methyltransferase [Dyella silvae]|uniref:class I SAM-dependent methyltransferase n=1 Tax=Dyella silvae TaxID=2994424 RepID=UPI002264EF3C|nr:class I SAM-dependent methyltransferase [Dyella silvae]